MNSIIVPVEDTSGGLSKIAADEKIDDVISKTLDATFVDPKVKNLDVFIYSHGWWTSTETALKQYNISISNLISALSKSGTRPPDAASFAIGVVWRSSISQEVLNKWNPLPNLAQLLRFQTDREKADLVGESVYQIIHKIVDAKRPSGEHKITLHLIGHSFGCRVIASALQKLAERDQELAKRQLDEINVVLLQAAFSTAALDKEALYGSILGKLSPRLLITTSTEDFALRLAFPVAQEIWPEDPRYKIRLAASPALLSPPLFDEALAFETPFTNLARKDIFDIVRRLIKTNGENDARELLDKLSRWLPNAGGWRVPGDKLADNLSDVIFEIVQGSSQNTALGATGPNKGLVTPDKVTQVNVTYDGNLVNGRELPPKKKTDEGTLVVANLSTAHTDFNKNPFDKDNKLESEFIGHHNDIYFPGLYDLLDWFFFGKR